VAVVATPVPGASASAVPPACQRSGHELLAERFARGEIDEQDYQRRLDTLHGKPGPLVKP